MNCGNSVIAYEARRRGNDVIATNNKTGMTIAGMETFYTNMRADSVCRPTINASAINTFGDLKNSQLIAQRSKQVEDSIKNSIKDSYKVDNARGCIFVPTYFGSHWFSWEKNGDVVTFSNPQDPSYDLSKNFLGYYCDMGRKPVQATAIRLDDLDFNESQMSSVVTNRVKGNRKQTYNTKHIDYRDIRY